MMKRLLPLLLVCAMLLATPASIAFAAEEPEVVTWIVPGDRPEDLEIVVKPADELEPGEVQEFTMVDKRDMTVPTGIEILRSPIVRALITLIILLGAVCAYYFGYLKRRKNA